MEKPSPRYPGTPLSPKFREPFLKKDTDGTFFYSADCQRVLPEPIVYDPRGWYPICSYCGVVGVMDRNGLYINLSHEPTCEWAIWKLENDNGV